jgi:hypothetical protein
MHDLSYEVKLDLWDGTILAERARRLGISPAKFLALLVRQSNQEFWALKDDQTDPVAFAASPGWPGIAFGAREGM